MKLLRLITRVNNTVKFNREIKDHPKESPGKLTKHVACSIHVWSNRSNTLRMFFIFTFVKNLLMS